MTDIDMERLEYFRDRYHALVVIDYKVADDNHTGSLLSLDDVIKRLNKVTVENEQLKQQVEDLYESDKSLRKFASNMTLNYAGICVPRRLFDEVLNILKDMGHNDLVEDLSKESIDTSVNGC